MYMFVDILYKLSMSVYCFVYMYEKWLYCSHVWMGSGKISC